MSASTTASLGRALALVFSLAFVAGAARAEESMPAGLQQRLPALLDLYRHFHRHPELSFQEDDSAARIAAALREAGFEVTEGVGGHGVVGVLANGEGPTVLVRGDMDALPVTEETGLPYASEVTAVTEAGVETGVMHACGHDVHMTVLVGTARLLAARRDAWRGTLVAIAQPAEERGAGARAMLRDGLFERFPRPDYNLALHVAADLPAGTIGYMSGYGTANVDSVDITVHGIGGHGAYPHATRDPVVLAANIVQGLQTLVSRTVSPIEPAVVTVGSVHGGSKHNIIPEQVALQLTVRSYTDAVREQLLAGIERVARGEARAFDLPENRLPEVRVKDEHTPAGYNDPALVERVVAAFQARFGEARVREQPPTMGGEDFARYGRQEPRIPSMMFWLGVVHTERYAASERGELTLPSLHSPRFRPDPAPSIETGMRAMAAAALTLLAPEADTRKDRGAR